MCVCVGGGGLTARAGDDFRGLGFSICVFGEGLMVSQCPLLSYSKLS